MCNENDYVLMPFVRKYCELTDRDIKDMRLKGHFCSFRLANWSLPCDMVVMLDRMLVILLFMVNSL